VTFDPQSWDEKLEEAASIYAAQCQDPKAKKAAMAYKGILLIYLFN